MLIIINVPNSRENTTLVIVTTVRCVLIRNQTCIQRYVTSLYLTIWPNLTHSAVLPHLTLSPLALPTPPHLTSQHQLHLTLLYPTPPHRFAHYLTSPHLNSHLTSLHHTVFHRTPPHRNFHWRTPPQRFSRLTKGNFSTSKQ